MNTDIDTDMDIQIFVLFGEECMSFIQEMTHLMCEQEYLWIMEKYLRGI